MTHSIPREAFEILEDTFHSREKAKKFAEAIEEIILYSQQEAKKEIEEKKNILKIDENGIAHCPKCGEIIEGVWE